MQFEDLEAWKKARKLVSHVYGLCRQPSLTRDYGIKDQIRRASVSVMSNLAEGFERTHKAEKIYLYKIARASAGEVRSLLYVIEDQEARRQTSWRSCENLWTQWVSWSPA